MRLVAERLEATFEAALQFAHTEGIISAEAAHAIRVAIDEALETCEAGESRVILFLSGHGHFDLAAYDAYLDGSLEDPEFDAREFKTRSPARRPTCRS